MQKRLIINADDFGLCEGVNKAIVEAHTNGVLTSTTIMTNMPAAQQAVELAKTLPTLGVGVHLNLTDGTPVRRDAIVEPLLGPDDNFGLSPGRLSLLSIASSKIRAAIEAELAAQIQWTIEKGLKPTHLDSHKHVHSFPAMFSIVCRLANRFEITAIRNTFEPKEVSRLPWPISDAAGRKRAATVRLMAKINLLQNRAFFKTDALLGVAHTGNINVNFLKAVSLYNRAATAEVMTHPGYTYDLDASRTRLVKQRQVELEALCSEKTKQYFKEAGVNMVHYGRL